MPDLHPSLYELPYHDGLTALRTARAHIAEAKRIAESQADADAAFEWAFVFEDLLGSIDSALAVGDASCDPVAAHTLDAPVRGPTGGTD